MINELPEYETLNIEILNRCFKKTANSYKFYWLLSILDSIIEDENLNINVSDLYLKMLSSVWYPLDHYKLSFGSQDGFKDLVPVVYSYIPVDNSLKANSLLQQIEDKLSNDDKLKLKHKIRMKLKRWVIFRFLTPFFESELKGHHDQAANEIILNCSNSNSFINYAPYRILNDSIIINENWALYLRQNQFILRGFIKWHLLKFVHKNNPNVIGLNEKLDKPVQRDMSLAKDYWRGVLTIHSLSCIYSKIILSTTNFSLDHFIPWSYVAHDYVWNIIPTTKSINSSKGNSLPNTSRYLASFCLTQYIAFRYHLERGNNKMIEDFYVLFKDQDLSLIDEEKFTSVIKIEILNNYRIAATLGFKTAYIFE